MSKDKLFWQGALPLSLSFDRYLYASMVDKFCTPDQTSTSSEQRAPPPPEQFVADPQFLFEPESDMDDENVVHETGEEGYDLSGRTIVI